jgi:hypothetical protein
MSEKDNKFEWSQFCRLGEMIGDGLHLEPDGKWISKEYNRLARLLMPDVYEAQRTYKKESVDKAVEEKLKQDKCPKCEGELKQTRSGCKVVKCQSCGSKFKYKSKKQ